MDSRFRDAEGFVAGRFCLPIAVGVALMIVAAGIAGRFREFTFWFALALVGQAVALQMIDAGRLIHYQHYKPLNRLLAETHPLILVFLLVQATLVAAGLRTSWPKIWQWLSRTFRVWQLIGVGVVFFFSSATVSPEIQIYVAELIVATFIQALNLANIMLSSWALPRETILSLKPKFENMFGHLGKQTFPGRVDFFAAASSLWVIILAVILGYFSYQVHPHVADEVGYLYHARYFAAGMSAMPAPPVPEAFSVDLMHYEKDRWYSPVPPGWPAMLALGVVAGAPWLVNPLLAGLNVLLAYLFVRELYDKRSARIAVLLLCISPWHVFMAMNFMTHTFTLTCALAAAVAVTRARKTGNAVWGWISGILTGVVSLIRPLDGFIVAGLLGLWAIGIGGRRLNASSIAGLIVGAVAVGGLVLPYNSMLTGQPTVFPLMAYFDKYYGPNSNALGFGPERGVGWAIDPFPGHSPIDSLVNANLNIVSTNIELFGWSTGSLIFIAVLLLSRGARRSDYIMLAVLAAVLGTYSLYWFSGGPDFGARYWYLVLVPCVALSVSGIRYLETTLRSTTTDASGNEARIMVGVLTLCLLTLLTYFPWRAIDKYFHYLRMRPDIRYMAKEYNFGRSLVLVRGDRFPDYASAAVYNPLDLRANAPVYAWDRNPETRAQVLMAYPDRPVWIVNGPSITQNGFRVVAGPLPSLQAENELVVARRIPTKKQE